MEDFGAQWLTLNGSELDTEYKQQNLGIFERMEMAGNMSNGTSGSIKDLEQQINSFYFYENIVKLDETFSESMQTAATLTFFVLIKRQYAESERKKKQFRFSTTVQYRVSLSSGHIESGTARHIAELSLSCHQLSTRYVPAILISVCPCLHSPGGRGNQRIKGGCLAQCNDGHHCVG